MEEETEGMMPTLFVTGMQAAVAKYPGIAENDDAVFMALTIQSKTSTGDDGPVFDLAFPLAGAMQAFTELAEEAREQVARLN